MNRLIQLVEEKKYSEVYHAYYSGITNLDTLRDNQGPLVDMLLSHYRKQIVLPEPFRFDKESPFLDILMHGELVGALNIHFDLHPTFVLNPAVLREHTHWRAPATEILTLAEKRERIEHRLERLRAKLPELIQRLTDQDVIIDESSLASLDKEPQIDEIGVI